MEYFKWLKFVNFLKTLLPPSKWKFPLFILTAIFLGLVLFILYISNAHSYLSDDPNTCINCHIMAPQYITWQKSSHREWTNCNDCHVPHDYIVRKYYFKAKDGIRHASMFTLRMEPQVILINDPGKSVVLENCIRCHENMNENVSLLHSTLSKIKKGEGRFCWDCHREVPHGRVNGLSSTSFARVPLLDSPVPEWLRIKINKNNNN